MAATTGEIAKVYTAAYIKCKTIAAIDSNPDTYTDSGNGFVKAGFADGDVVTISGFTTSGNNGVKTIVSVVAGTITLGTALTAELAGDEVIIVKNAPGDLRAGISGWTTDESVDIAETTDFDDLVSATKTATTIAFVDGAGSDDTITDSGNGFVAAGFVAGKEIMITGSTSNNLSTTPSIVAVGVLTVPTGTLTGEIAGDTVTIKQFDLWKTFTAELKEWAADIDAMWFVDTFPQPFFGIPHWFRFFIRYYATPSGGSVAIYKEGLGIIDNISTPLVAGRLIKQPFKIRGIGSLTQRTKTSAW